MKRLGFFLILAIFLAIGVFTCVKYFSYEFFQGNSQAKNPLPQSKRERLLHLPERLSHIGREKVPPLREILPTLSALRAEVAEDPHHVPLSLLEFARAIAQHFENLSEENSSNFFQELLSCVESESSVTSNVVRAFCLRNAKAVAEKFPHLATKVDTLWQRASAQLRELAEE